MNCLLNTNFDELNDKEVRELISEYLETGNEEIRNKITYSYSKHVYRIAEGMVRGSLTVEDLFQEGIVALWKAIPLFNVNAPSSCLAFFNKVILTSLTTVYNSREINGYLFQKNNYNEEYIQAYEELVYVLNRKPKIQEFADYIGKSSNDIFHIYQGLAKMESIEESKNEILNMASEIRTPEESVVNKIYYKAVFKKAINYLTDRELYIYMCHKDWGFNAVRVREDLAKDLKVSRLRIEQLEKKAENKIKLLDKYYLKGNKRNLASVLSDIFRDDLAIVRELIDNLEEDEIILLKRRYTKDLKEIISDDFTLQEMCIIYKRIIPKLNILVNNSLKLSMKKPGI